jgi:type 1 glutamine amidotransferase
MRVLLYRFSTSAITGVMAQVAAFQQTLQGWGYQVDQVTDPMNGMVFSDTNLAKYAAVGMINTCFFPFGANKNDTAAGIPESQALKKFVQGGGGLFGTHCAEVTFTAAASMPLYNLTLGGWAHAGNSGDNANMTCMKVGADHPASAMLPASFMYKGNVDFAVVAPDTTVLVNCTYGGNTTTPVSWVRTEGTGRVFNTSFGKVQADLTDATIGVKHIIAGLGWVLGR